MRLVNGEEATITHWAAASREAVLGEFLAGVGSPADGGSAFLAPKYENNHGGSGRPRGILP